MIYALIVTLIVAAGDPPVEVRIPFKTHEECVAQAAEITGKISRYSGFFGVKVDSSGCFKT